MASDSPSAAKPFSTAIRRARRDLHRSQQEIADALGVRQNTISAWERGIQLPTSADGERLPRLAEALELDLDELRTLLVQQEARHSETDIARDLGNTIELIEEHIQQLGPENTRVYLTATHRFPPEAFPELRDAWVSWIQAGVEFHVLWFLDLIPPRRLDHAGRCLWDMAPKIRQAWRDRPGVVHYPTAAFADHPGPNLDTYLEIAGEQIPKNTFQDFRRLSGELQGLLVPRAAASGLTLLAPKTRRGNPLALMHIQAATGPRLRQSADIWVPLDREVAVTLLDALASASPEGARTPG